MNTLLRRWRVLTVAEGVIRILRVCVLLRAALPVVRTAVKLWKGKGR